MTHPFALKFAAGLAVVLIAMPATADDTKARAEDEAKDEKKVAIDELPEAVRRAATRAVRAIDMRVEWEEATCEEEEGSKVYEIEGKNEQGREVEIEVGEDGTVEGLEVSIPESEVPEAVKKALKSHLPDFQCEEVEAIYKDGRIDAYEFEGTQGGEDVTACIGKDGTLREKEKDGKEGEDPEK